MKLITACIVLPILLVSNALAELAKPVRILDDDIPHAAPFFTDIDGDGKNDLLVGSFREGPFTGARVKVYRNMGTNQESVFDDGAWMQAGDADATVDEFCVTGFGPQVIDFNGDGIRDLISGSRASELYLFAGREDGSFDAANAMQYVPDENERRNFAHNSRLFAHDWDSDGDMDLLVARYKAVWLIRNDGDPKTPSFSAPAELLERQVSGLSLSVVTVADWDSDGRHDLVVGRSDGSVVWHRNEGERGAEPSLGAAQVLVGEGLPFVVKKDFNGNYEAPAGPTRHVRLCVADYNDDGLPDLLLGDSYTVSASYDEEHPRPQRSEEQKAADRRKQALERQLWALKKVPEGESEVDRVAREKKLAAIRQRGAVEWQGHRADYSSSFGRHGSVWLFERIAR